MLVPQLMAHNPAINDQQIDIMLRTIASPYMLRNANSRPIAIPPANPAARYLPIASPPLALCPGNYRSIPCVRPEPPHGNDHAPSGGSFA